MSKDAVLENEEELDVFSLVANQGEGDEDDADENVGELPDDAESLKAMVAELQERVSKRNKSLKTSKNTNHRMQEQIDALRSTLDELKNKSEAPADRGRTQEELERQAQEWADRVEANPAEAIRYADWKQSKLEENLGNVLGNFMQRVESQFAELKAASNPERLQYQKEVAMLRQNPDFADMDDAALVKIAKTLKGVKRPPGTAGGQRATATKGKGPSSDEITDALRKMGFDK